MLMVFMLSTLKASETPASQLELLKKKWCRHLWNSGHLNLKSVPRCDAGVFILSPFISWVLSNLPEECQLAGLAPEGASSGGGEGGNFEENLRQVKECFAPGYLSLLSNPHVSSVSEGTVMTSRVGTTGIVWGIDLAVVSLFEFLALTRACHILDLGSFAIGEEIPVREFKESYFIFLRADIKWLLTMALSCSLCDFP